MRHVIQAAALAALLALAAGLPGWAAPTAVATANAEEGWYTSRADDLVNGEPRWAGYTAVSGYAPLPVFFEGHASTPRAEVTTPRVGIVDYEWDFDVDDPGNPTYHGFCYSHVYEDPGTYTARLTVTDDAGLTDTEDVVITVTARPGPVYYVDSETGDDANDGLSEAGAWRTATKAWTAFRTKALAPGSSVLFRRGQTFELQSLPLLGHYASGYGVLFGAFGVGADPVIQRVTSGTDTTDVLALVGASGHENWMHTTIRDLVFECRLTTGAVAGTLATRADGTHGTIALPPGHGFPATGIKRDVYWTGGYRYQMTATVSGDTMTVSGGTGHYLPAVDTAVTVGPTRGDGVIFQGRTSGLLFQRCTFNHAIQSYGLNGHPTYNGSGAATNAVISGVFAEDCTFYESANLHVFFKGARLALVGCTADLSENHGLYGDWIKSGYIYGNTFTRVPFGRTGLRISGESGWFTDPTINVVVRNNSIVGRVDPIIDNGTHAGGGTRYQWVSAEVAPNAPNNQSIEWVDWAYNTVSGCETFLFITDAENVDIHHNTLSTVSPDTSSCRINFNPRMGLRPCKNVVVRDNAITTWVAGDINNNPRVFGVNHWAGAAYGEQTVHENIRLEDNAITQQNRIGTGIWHSTADAADNAELHSQNTWTGVDRQADKAVKLGGSYNVAGTQYSLDGWYLLTGNEAPDGGEPEEPPADPPADPGDKLSPFLLGRLLVLFKHWEKDFKE